MIKSLRAATLLLPSLVSCQSSATKDEAKPKVYAEGVQLGPIAKGTCTASTFGSSVTRNWF
jgi:hypothetical protein